MGFATITDSVFTLEEATMPVHTPNCPVAGKDLESEAERLAQFLKERFPEEAAGVDADDPRGALRLAVKLLERLWRWER
jgi:hypothetical protein